MTATQLITELRGYHRQQALMLGQLRSGELDVVDLPPLLPKTVLEMVRHLVQEEVLLVPLVSERLGEDAARDCLDRLRGVEEAARILERTPMADPAFPEVVERLERSYIEHARWQETTLFAQMEAAVPDEELEDAGRAVSTTMEVGPTQSHPADFRPASIGWPAPGLVDRLQAQLRTQGFGVGGSDGG